MKMASSAVSWFFTVAVGNPLTIALMQATTGHNYRLPSSFTVYFIFGFPEDEYQVTASPQIREERIRSSRTERSCSPSTCLLWSPRMLLDAAMKCGKHSVLVRLCSTVRARPKPRLYGRRTTLVFGSSVLLASGCTAAYLLDHPPPPRSPSRDDRIKNPIEMLDAEHLRASTAHLHDLTGTELLRAWVTYTMCTSSTLVSYSPTIVKHFEWFRDTIPLLGPLSWRIFCEVSTFFSHR